MTGLPDPQLAIHAVGMPARFSWIVKPFCLRMPVRYFGRLELLEPELAEAEDLVVHPLNHFLKTIHLLADVAACSDRAPDWPVAGVRSEAVDVRALAARPATVTAAASAHTTIARRDPRITDFMSLLVSRHGSR